MIDEAQLGGRLPLQSVDLLTGEQRILYDRLTTGRLGKAPLFKSRTETGELIGPFNACLYAPAMGGGFIDFHEAEERATPLSARSREVVILSAGAVWAADYELYAHRRAAAHAGLDPADVEALSGGRPAAGLSADEAALQRFTLELVGERRVSDEMYATVEGAVGREALVAAIFLAAAYCSTCLLLNAFSVPAPFEMTQALG